MKHCIIMTVYKDLSMINKFINHVPNNWGVYVHIDRKSDITESQIARGHIFKKFKIYWGGREHLDAFLFLLREALSDNEKFDYFHLVTGQDFFACPPDKFDEVLGTHNYSYIEVFSLPKQGWWNYRILRDKTLSSYCDVRRPIYKRINRIYCKYQAMIFGTKKLPPYKIYGGSVYCSLTFEAVEEILSSKIGQDLYERLQGSLCGEEVFFQTVLMNSKLKDKVRSDRLRYIDWTVQSPPKTLTEEDLEKIISSKNIFCRKVDSVKSSVLLQHLELFGYPQDR